MSVNLNLLPGLKKTNYVQSDLHALLDSNAMSNNGLNIGHDGVNLTITCLSMSRISLTEKLVMSILKHIPNFKGEVLIIDNGSSPEEIVALRAILAHIPLNIRFVELNYNHGVSGGRNRTLEHVRTDWVMFLDNDIYFIDNPLIRLQKDISILGCHFINMPLLAEDKQTLFAYGGNLFLDMTENAIHIGAGSAYCQEKVTHYDNEGFLSTFLFGGASVVKVTTLKRLEAFDENMFIGFEDIDLSIRLYQAGMKVGTCGAIVLVHDHPKPSSDKDISYERVRFTRDILKQSADYLEKKWGMQFWSSPVDDWLDEKRRTLKLDCTSQPNVLKTVDKSAPPAKPRIALIIDTENWAFANIANQIVRYLSDFFEFTVIPTSIVENISQIIMMTKDYDITHFFWRESLRLIWDDYYIAYNKQIGFDEALFKQNYLKHRIITTSIYDHLFLDESSIAIRKNFYNELVTSYTVSSSKLFDIYSAIDGYPNPSILAEDGVDLSLFYPEKLDRFDNLANRNLRIGWVGNSKWGGDILNDPKGYHSILKPAVDQLQAEGLNIELVIADRQVSFTPHKEMVNYYKQIDLYVCVSESEGTPNPLLESMACGVPIITTDVGLVSDALGKMQKKWILPKRDINILIDRLRDFYLQRGVITKQLSAENLQQITQWDWKLKVNNFKRFFDDLLNNKNI